MKLFTILVMKTILFLQIILLFLIFPLCGNGQLVVVTGNIVNQSNGNFLESVNVLESISGIGTITNIHGFFSLMLKPGKAEFVITQNGFKDFSKKMTLKNDTTITVSLVPVFNLKSKQKDSENKETAGKLENGKYQ